MKKFWTVLMGVGVAATLAMPVLADELRARIKAVDVDKNTVTVIEGHKDYVLAATGDTKFLNVAGGSLANGIKSGDLKEGRRVVVDFDAKDGALVLSSLKIRR